MAQIHPSAIIDPSAILAEDVIIGPFSIIGAGVSIGSGSRIGAYTTIEGPTTIGRNNRIYNYASIGCDPQDKKYRGEQTQLIIGDDNVIREYVTFSRGTVQDGGITQIGHRNWIMAYAHIAHDCVVGDDIILANAASLAGHVKVANKAILGGFTSVHQFVEIGEQSFTGLGTVVKQDIPAYVMATGNPAAPHGLNLEGLKRRGWDKDDMQLLRRAYRLVYLSGTKLESAIEEMLQWPDPQSCLQPFIHSIQTSSRGIIR